MAIETVLTDEKIFALGAEIDITSVNPDVDVLMFSRDEFLAESRAIEQAVLQSPEVQRLREDKKRLDWLESSISPHGFCHTGNGDYRFYAHQQTGFKTVRESIDAAMEKQQ